MSTTWTSADNGATVERHDAVHAIRRHGQGFVAWDCRWSSHRVLSFGPVRQTGYLLWAARTASPRRSTAVRAPTFDTLCPRAPESPRESSIAPSWPDVLHCRVCLDETGTQASVRAGVQVNGDSATGPGALRRWINMATTPMEWTVTATSFGPFTSAHSNSDMPGRVRDVSWAGGLGTIWTRC